MKNQLGNDAPRLVCSLPAGEVAARRLEIDRHISNARSVHPTADGVSLQFDSSDETAHVLIDFVLFEKVCCKDLVYELRSEPNHDLLILNLYAPPKQVAALQEIYITGAVAQPPRRFPVSQLVASFGAALCGIVCLGGPATIALCGWFGLGFLRNDRILFPFEFMCCALLFWCLEKNRRVHRRIGPSILTVPAVAALMWSMWSKTMTNVLASAGVACLSFGLILDHRSYRAARKESHTSEVLTGRGA